MSSHAQPVAAWLLDRPGMWEGEGAGTSSKHPNASFSIFELWPSTSGAAATLGGAHGQSGYFHKRWSVMERLQKLSLERVPNVPFADYYFLGAPMALELREANGL